MINTLIIEDEQPAANRLVSLLRKIDPSIHISEVADTVKGAIAWLSANPAPDLILLDIQLGDGISFEIFRKIKIDSYVIFTTAYDEYAIRAFEVNSIDYLLKPIDENKLAAGIEKYRRLKNQPDKLNFEKLLETLEKKKEKYKKKFVVSIANKIKVIQNEEIAYFYSKEKNTYTCTCDNRHYPLDFSLDHIEQIIDPDIFFRINRQFIVRNNCISKIEILSKSRIRIQTNPPSDEELMISSARTSEFRNWLEK